MLKIKWKYTTLTFRINTPSEGILFYGNFCVASNPKQNSSWFNIFICYDETHCDAPGPEGYSRWHDLCAMWIMDSTYRIFNHYKVKK